MKTYEFEFNCDKATAVEKILHDVKKPTFWVESNEIYGRASKNNEGFVLYFGNAYGNKLRFVFDAKATEGEAGRTVIRGKWRLSAKDCVIFVLWYAFLILLAVLPLVTDGSGSLIQLYATVLLFSTFPVVFSAISYALEKQRMQRITEHIRMHQGIINDQ